MLATELPHENVMTRLGASTIHGIGVFALKDIAIDTQLFVDDEADIHWIDADAIGGGALTDTERAFYEDFAIRRDGQLGCPTSFDLLTPGWYLNQPLAGDEANVRADSDYRIFAARQIDVGEELTLDYPALNCGPTWS